MNNYPQFEQELKALLSKYNVRLEAENASGFHASINPCISIYVYSGQTLGKKTWKHVEDLVSIGGDI
jgi:hypothetical protein